MTKYKITTTFDFESDMSLKNLKFFVKAMSPYRTAIMSETGYTILYEGKKFKWGEVKTNVEIKK